MTTWITDANGNRASVEYWGSEDAARASLATLRDCRDCTNCTRCMGCMGCTNCTGCMGCTGCEYCTDCAGCSRCTDCTNCTGCWDCTRCTDCTGCEYCTDCTDCTDCVDCNLSSRTYYRLPVSDPRGYTWLAVLEDGEWRIRAGCRSYSIDEAREHWLSADYDGPETVQETVGFALDWISEKEMLT